MIRYRLERRRRRYPGGVVQRWIATDDAGRIGVGSSIKAARADLRPDLERALDEKFSTPAFRRLERALRPRPA